MQVFFFYELVLGMFYRIERMLVRAVLVPTPTLRFSGAAKSAEPLVCVSQGWVKGPAGSAVCMLSR